MSLIFHLFVLLVGILIGLLLKNTPSCFDICWEYYGKSYMPIDQNQTDLLISSSVWCSGYNNINRKCKFKNLCYLLDKAFVFFHGQNSLIVGISGGHLTPLLDMSSVADHNQLYFDYVDLPQNASKDFKVEFISGSSIILKRFNPENLMHVIHDDILPLFATLLELCTSVEINEMLDCFKKVQIVFADGRPNGKYFSVYKLLTKNILTMQEFSPEVMYCFKTAYVGLNKESVWYQYGFKEPQGPTNGSEKVIKTAIIKAFVNFVKHKLQVEDTQSEPNQHYAILATRKQNRLIVNQMELMELIENVTKLKVFTVNLEENNLFDVIKMITNAKYLIGMHGSLLILSIFLSPGASIIELFPYAINPDYITPYKTFAMLSGVSVNYYSWKNNEIDKTIIPPSRSPEEGGIDHLTEEQRNNILKSEEVQQHLCCYNPEWLFRIYQDTIVDLQSFSRILEKAVSDKKSDYSNQEAFILNRLYPSEVDQISCHVTEKQLQIRWKISWNIKYFYTSNLHYQVLLQEEHRDAALSFETENSYFNFSAISLNTEYFVWVRCVVDGRNGPFNSYNVRCMA